MTALSDPLLAAFVTMLVDTLAVMVPGGNDDADTKEARATSPGLLFEAFQPRDAIEAMAPARAVAERTMPRWITSPALRSPV
jgi:hypothetical protein